MLRTKRQWSVIYAVLFFVGFFVGILTSAPIPSSSITGYGPVTEIIAFGMRHLSFLTVMALICLTWPLVRGKATGSKALVLYFGIGICVARLMGDVGHLVFPNR